MITTNSFPNIVTPAPENINIEKNSLVKEDLEGGIKKNITSYPQSKNGGACQNIEI
jgi:hypothetical protein